VISCEGIAIAGMVTTDSKEVAVIPFRKSRREFLMYVMTNYFKV
jgi:hypothetical protein